MAPIAVAAAAAVFLAGNAAAQSPTVSLTGHLKHPQQVTLDDLKKLPAQHTDVTYQTDRGPVTAGFTGAPLWSLIEMAGGLDDAEKNAAVRHAIRVTARDGYVMVTSTGEIAPDFGGKQALVAYERDGKSLDDFRIVMPGDKHGARNVRDITAIAVE
ncbi:MAG TPA: hypothetical protein VM782_17450 [Stellaceae bacterium]|nr:hypothetical protein [Stellaceae bacterium]